MLYFGLLCWIVRHKLHFLCNDKSRLQGAAKNKYLKDIPVEKVQAYETGLISYVNREYPYILDQIESKKELDEDLESQIKAALDAFTKEFLLMEGAQDGTK